jgi:hypothetical protein
MYWCVMVCTGRSKRTGVSCSNVLYHTAHYKSGHNPNQHTFWCFICQPCSSCTHTHTHTHTHTCPQGAGENVEWQEAGSTDRQTDCGPAMSRGCRGTTEIRHQMAPQRVCSVEICQNSWLQEETPNPHCSSQQNIMQ